MKKIILTLVITACFRVAAITPGFYFYNGSLWIQVSTGSSTNFWPANGSHISNSNAGNVGIGTSNPSYKLTLQTASGYGFVHTNGTIGVGSYVGGLDIAGGWYGTPKTDRQPDA